MINQLTEARNGNITPYMKAVAVHESVDPASLRDSIAKGRAIILGNNKHKDFTPKGIGAGLSVKINANIGTSTERVNVEEELQKLQVAEDAGADVIMDLSTGGDLDSIRKIVMSRARVPIGTVPIYQAAVQAVQKRKSITKLDPEELFDVIEKHGEDGVDFVTVHCGVTREVIERLRKQGRIADIVSRGGAFLTEWMVVNNKENPLYAQFDRLVAIAKKYDMTLSLGDGLRPGSIVDATDRCQIQELLTLGELCEEAQKSGVQVMIEGPGHVPLNQIEANIVLEKKLCNGAPFYVLGPIVTDIAPGYDHITSAIGGALAGYCGADFICYVTPSEHLGLPTINDVRDGVVVARIAAHAADLARGNKAAWARDELMSRYRKALDWEGQIATAIDPEKIKAFRKERNLHDDVCSMCGEYCAMKIVTEYLKKD
jgi:phosphomethylpyrimidine synthase